MTNTQRDGGGRRAVRGPGLIISLAIALIAVVMLIAMLVARPWQGEGIGDPSGERPTPTATR